MKKDTIYQRMQFQNEFDSLVWQMMTRVKRGETIPDNGQYQRVKSMLQERAKAILANPEIIIETESDWLALALFAEDRRFFAEICLEADSADDPIFRSAARWLERIIETTVNQYYGSV